jgi:lipid-binding SYLF domain-containing protein
MKLRHLLFLGCMTGLMAVTGCTTTDPSSRSSSPAEKRAQINTGAEETLSRLYASVPGSRDLGAKARGILVFPNVISAGFVFGGEYGEGALREGSMVNGYYRTTGASFGFQAGAQSRAIVIMFMNQVELDRFKNSNGWTAGVDGSVAVAKAGVNGGLDTNTARAPVVAFALTNAGLMANLTINGSKITKIDMQ